jgi:hypothetical protein
MGGNPNFDRAVYGWNTRTHQAASTRNDAPVSFAEIEMLYVDARDGYTRENYVSQSNVMQGLKRVLDKLGVKYE